MSDKFSDQFSYWGSEKRLGDTQYEWHDSSIGAPFTTLSPNP